MLSGPKDAAPVSDFEYMCLRRQSHMFSVSVRFLLKTRNHDVTKSHCS